MKVLRSDLRLPSKVLLDDPTSADSAPDLSDLDESKHDYVTAIKPAFDCLRDVAAQVAGLLLLAVSGGKSAAGHPMLPVALESHAGAADLLGTARVPSWARHQHAHLVQASVKLRAALNAAKNDLRCGGVERFDAILKPLRESYAELQRAADALPGIETVSLSQGCCCRRPDVNFECL
jgi:hypothetical protein